MKTIIIVIIIIFTAGCSSTSLRQGRYYMAKEEYDNAIKSFKIALDNDPDNPRIQRDTGIAYYKAREYLKASSELEKAKKKLDEDGLLMFYLGLTYERLGQYEKAIQEYSGYTRLGPFNTIKKKLNQRIYLLSRQQASQWAIKRMLTEREINPAEIPNNTIAVTYFKPINVSEELKPLLIGLADLIIVDLSFVKQLTVIERIKLKEIYEELGFSTTDFVDQNTAPRMGKLLGANHLVTGTFTGINPQFWRIILAMGETKANNYQLLKGIEGDNSDFIKSEKSLVLEILKNLKIEITPEDREKIISNVPTKSLQAFLAYSRGLDYLDKGMYSKAIKELESAISIDPRFDRAKMELSNAKLLSQAIEPIKNLEISFESAMSIDKNKRDFMAGTMGVVSQGNINRAPFSEPRTIESSGEKQEIQIDILIQW